MLLRRLWAGTEPDDRAGAGAVFSAVVLPRAGAEAPEVPE
jgi:hypothetical protein